MPANCPASFSSASVCSAGSKKYDLLFSGTQGKDGFTYQTRNAVTGYKDMTFAGGTWSGVGGSASKTTIVPGTTDAVVINYKVPGSGTLKLNSTFALDAGSADGVTFQLQLGDNVVSQKNITAGQTLSVKDPIDVATGDIVRFVFLPKVSNTGDTITATITGVLSTCQGKANAATCGSSICGTAVVDDDAGCGATVVARTCTPYANVVCDGTQDQQETACPETCESGAELSSGACPDTTPVCTLEFDEGTGTKCGDLSGNGFLGLLEGINLPQWVKGLVGWGLKFGQFGVVGGPVDNVVTIQGSSTLRFGGGLMVGCWINWGGGSGDQIIIG